MLRDGDKEIACNDIKLLKENIVNFVTKSITITKAAKQKRLLTKKLRKINANHVFFCFTEMPVHFHVSNE